MEHVRLLHEVLAGAQEHANLPMDVLRTWVLTYDLEPAKEILRMWDPQPEYHLAALEQFTSWRSKWRAVLFSTLAERVGPLTSDPRDGQTIKEPVNPIPRGTARSFPVPVSMHYVTPEPVPLADQELRVIFPSRRGWIRGALAIAGADGPQDLRGLDILWDLGGGGGVIQPEVSEGPYCRDDSIGLPHGGVVIELDVPVGNGRNQAVLRRHGRGHPPLTLAEIVFTADFGTRRPAWRPQL
jgi:hypothetical protein